MFTIDDSTKSITVVLGEAAATQLECNASYVDSVIPQARNILTNDTTPVTIVDGTFLTATSSVSGSKRIESISIFNSDTISHRVIVALYDSTTYTRYIAVDINVGYTLHYDNTWYVTDSDGALTTTIVSIIRIGDLVIGGDPTALLYIDSDGLLANSILKQIEDGITIPDDKYIMSATPNKSVLGFGANGDNFLFYTDGITSGSETQVVFTPASITLHTVTGRYFNGNHGISINHDEQITIDLSGVSVSPISIGTTNALLIGVGNTSSATTVTGTLNLASRTASTVPYIDTSKNVVSSAVTPTELGYVSGVTSSIQTQLNSLLTGALANTKIFIGNGSNVATAQTLSLNASGGTFGLGNTGILTIENADAATRGLLTNTDWSTFNSKESALTFSTGLTRTVNTITVNTSQNIVKLSNLITNGFVKTSASDGTLSIDTSVYITTAVSSVSVVTANGISGSVATATTTPAITLTLGAITPSSVNSVVLSGSSTPTLAVTGTSSISGTNTGDQTNISGNAATVTTNANLTGPVTSVGNATSIANLAITNAMIAAATIDLTAKVTGILPLANLPNIYIPIYFQTGNLSPSDSTTYYFGMSRTFVPTLTATDQDFNIGIKCQLIRVVFANGAATAGSNENSTMQLRNVTQATSGSIGTFQTNFTNPVAGSFSLVPAPISVAAGDSITGQWDTPAWATNPVNTTMSGVMIFIPVP